MAWRITDSLVKAELDNRKEGRVTGTLTLFGREETIQVTLSGNFYRDIAGCLLTIENPHPVGSESTELEQEQDGRVGEMTASKKVRVLDIPVEEAIKLRASGKPVPDHWSNAVYLEWFSDNNGRVVIESERYKVSISAPEWIMTPEEETAQQRTSDDLKEEWALGLQQQIEAFGFGPDEPEIEILEVFEEEEPDKSTGKDEQMPPQTSEETLLDEFAWEQELRRCDERTDQYMELLEKYEDDPEAQGKIAEGMGWTGLPSAEEIDAGLIDLENLDILSPEPPPSPEDEGTLWIRTEDGRVVHPLYHRAHDNAMGLWTMCDDAGFLGETGDSNVQLMVDQAMLFTTKLAGALNSLHLDPDIDTGFIIALLKRALPAFNECIEAMDDVEGESLIPSQLLAPFRDSLYGVRQDVLRLMDEMRNE